MAKKTQPVADILAFANYQLARTDEFATVDFKCGICSMIERVLHDTGNYEGFGFLDNSDSETGTLGYYSRFYTFSPSITNQVLYYITGVIMKNKEAIQSFIRGIQDKQVVIWTDGNGPLFLRSKNRRDTWCSKGSLQLHTHQVNIDLKQHQCTSNLQNDVALNLSK
jgi:hypothetical protein